VQNFELLRSALNSYDPLNPLDSAKTFLESLGYPTMEPLPLDLDMSEGIQKILAGINQLVTVGKSSPFRVFHVEVGKEYVGRQGQILRQPLRRFLESFYKHYPQGENLFIFVPHGFCEKLTFVSPRRLLDPRDPGKVRLWLRILQVNPQRPYRTDLETLCKIRADDVQTPEEIWRRHDEAFSVQRVTEQFFRDYKEVFRRIQGYLKEKHKASPPDWVHDYTHQLLNRIMFLYFIARKGWLLGPDGQPDQDFIMDFWVAYRESGAKNEFHSEWLKVLFFEAFNGKWQNRHEYLERFPQWLINSLSQAPFLNGGLYTRRSGLDDCLSTPIPDEYFELLFEKWTDGTSPGLFERYNFTVVETGRFEEEVAVDPEMLGMVYERLVNLTFGAGEENGQGTAGVFYTPRVEIDLMCRLAVVDWLKNRLGNDKRDLLYQWVFAFSEDEKQEADEAVTREGLWDELDKLVRRVRVCDPACGSGSFLVGMMLVLDDLQARCNHILGRNETPYERRKRILQDQLYGVDVMEWAVRVAELRLWLQLVVETELEPAERRFRPLLPNLDLKLRPGDSLLQTVGDLDLSPFRRSELHLPAPLKGRLTKFKGKKRRFFQGEERGLTTDLLKQEEVNLFREILLAKVHELDNQIKARRREMQLERSLPGMEKLRGKDEEKKRRLALKIEALEREKARYEQAREVLHSDQPSPFVWDLSFVEVFGDEDPGFDIVIGNPPYVRQEKIRDYLGRFDRQKYLERLNQGLRAVYPAFMDEERRISGRADYYVYFYLHGMSLLADRGTFCFITSNSWLDVDFGKDLQEFFLRHGHLKMVIDNCEKRSFARADVNTVIVLAGTPEGKRTLSEKKMQEHPVHFVTFRVPFETALSPILFSEIEDEGLYKPLAGLCVLTRPEEFRAVLRDQWSLYEEGLEEAKGEHLVDARKYAGNKWGGKYLRAPDIFFTILEKGGVGAKRASPLLVRLGDIAEVLTVSWSRQGQNAVLMIRKSAQKPSEEMYDVLKSPKDVSTIKLKRADTRYLLRPVKWVKRQLVYAPILWVDLRGNKHICHRCLEQIAFTHNFHGINPFDRQSIDLLCAVLNSTLNWLFIEILGRRGLGGGAVRVLVEDLKRQFLVVDLSAFTSFQHQALLTAFEQMANRPVKSIFEELGFTICRRRGCQQPEHPYEFVKPEELTLEQVRQASPDRFELDSVVFDVLGLTGEERLQVYQAVAQLVKDRLVKARSV